MDREPFAKVVSFCEGVGEDFRIEIEGIPVYCPNNDSGETADKINAAHEAAVAHLQAKAELADRMAEALRYFATRKNWAWNEEDRAIFNAYKLDGMDIAVAALSEYDSLKGKPEKK